MALALSLAVAASPFLRAEPEPPSPRSASCAATLVILGATFAAGWIVGSGTRGLESERGLVKRVTAAKPLLAPPLPGDLNQPTLSTVIPVQEIYHITEGKIHHVDGYALPGSEGTIEIGSFQNLLLRLNAQGKLSGFWPMTEEWVDLSDKTFSHFLATSQTLIALGEDGVAYEFAGQGDHYVTYPEEGFLIGNRPIRLQATIDGLDTLMRLPTEFGFAEPGLIALSSKTGKLYVLLDDGTRMFVDSEQGEDKPGVAPLRQPEGFSPRRAVNPQNI